MRDKGLSMNNVCTLARAPGGQMRGAATQAMRCHRRGAATKQIPARRRAPLGCGPGGQQQNVTFIHYQALRVVRAELRPRNSGRQDTEPIYGRRRSEAKALSIPLPLLQFPIG